MLDLNFVLRTGDLAIKLLGDRLGGQALEMLELAKEIRNGTKAGWAPTVREWCPAPAGRKKVDTLRVAWEDWHSRVLSHGELCDDIVNDIIIEEALQGK